MMKLIFSSLDGKTVRDYKIIFFQRYLNVIIFFGVPHLATCISLIFNNEPELGAEIDPCMALTPLPSSIGWGLNPQPSDREPSALPLDHSFRLYTPKCCLKLLTRITFTLIYEYPSFQVHNYYQLIFPNLVFNS
jgi:hypothetical protein